MTQDDLIIQGEKLSELVAKGSFTDAVFLLLSGRKATGKESKIFSAMLTSVIDHGMGTTSAMASRFVMSAGNPLNTAVGAGILALGEFHGGAIEQAMRQLQTVTDIEKLVDDAVAKKITLSGFGHKIYKEADPRVKQLLGICKKEGFSSKYIDLALKVEKLFEQKKGKKIVFNVDGFIAAALLEMGFSPEAARGFFIIGRTPGLVAQAIEEKEKEPPVRRVDEEEIRYVGKI